MTDEQNVQESENIVKHQDLIGKYVKIKDKYFLDNNIDLKVVASLKEYYKKGIYFGIVKSVSEGEGNINAYVEFNEPIGGIPSLFVPVDQVESAFNNINLAFLSSIALYFSTERPQPLKMTTIDVVFAFFYIMAGISLISIVFVQFYPEY